MKNRKERKFDGQKQRLLHDIIEVVVIFLAVFLFFRFVVGVSFVKGTSMFPTLHNDEVAVYTRIIPTFERGDVLSVRMPSGDYYVKRVIAVGGDTVDIKRGQLYVNGELMEEAYIYGDTKTKIGGVDFPYEVEDEKVFVMGDNREGSMDSRDFGAVTRKQIKGKIWIYIGKI